MRSIIQCRHREMQISFIFLRSSGQPLIAWFQTKVFFVATFIFIFFKTSPTSADTMILIVEIHMRQCQSSSLTIKNKNKNKKSWGKIETQSALYWDQQLDIFMYLKVKLFQFGPDSLINLSRTELFSLAHWTSNSVLIEIRLSQSRYDSNHLGTRFI